MCFKIAGLNIEMSYSSELLRRQGGPYRLPCEDHDRMLTGHVAQCSSIVSPITSPDISLALPPSFVDLRLAEHPHLTRDECEYIWLGAQFYEKLLDHDGFLLHASGLAYDGRAYLFSAGSGVGKSTHTQLWRGCFGADKVSIINDDKPAIRLIDGEFVVFGTPFSGKTDLNQNISVPLQAICFLERAETDWIQPISSQEAIPMLLEQTLRPSQPDRMVRLLDLIDQLLGKVPVYRMGATMRVEAADLLPDILPVEPHRPINPVN